MTNWTNELFTAIRENDKGMLQTAVFYGADVNAHAKDGNTPLMEAAYNGRWNCLRYLIDEGADIHANSDHGSDALTMASFGGHTKCVELLLEHGAEPNREDQLGYTALIFAVVSGHEETVECLLKHGADPEFQTQDGKTAKLEAREVGGPAAKDIQNLIDAAILDKHFNERQQDKRDQEKSLEALQKRRQIARRRLVRGYTKKKFGS